MELGPERLRVRPGIFIKPRDGQVRTLRPGNIYGACTAACGGDEKKVLSGKGPNKYICVKKCSKKNEAWSDRKNTCVCKDGYSRDEKGECVPRK